MALPIVSSFLSEVEQKDGQKQETDCMAEIRTYWCHQPGKVPRYASTKR